MGVMRASGYEGGSTVGLWQADGVRRAIGAWAAAVLLTGLGSGCAKPDVSDLEAYEVVPMGKAMPAPSEEERGKRVFEVAVVDRPSEGLDEARLHKSRTQVRHGVEKIAASHGAAVIEPSGPEDEALRTDQAVSPFADLEVETIRTGDYTLSARFSNYHHAAKWTKPAKLPWQTAEEAAKKPGTCTHTAEVAFDVAVVETTWEPVVRRTYLLNHRATQESKDLDPACTISRVTIESLFETAIDEALACLDIPLGSRISPRGHVLAHRKAKDGETHIFQVSLGTEQGVDPEEPLEFRRVELSKGPLGEEIRTETVIATGIATHQITAQDTWVAVALDDVKKEILEGDVVKRVFAKGLLGDLTGPDCKKILAER